MYERKIEENLDCGIYLASKVFGGKWKCCILDAINRGVSRPVDICNYIPDASKRVIEMQLAELLFYGIIEKISEDVYPKKSEYNLSALGESILPILSQMEEWGVKNKEYVKQVVGKQNISEQNMRLNGVLI
jgi:DNA-binding HxlR family transcriptional regulator